MVKRIKVGPGNVSNRINEGPEKRGKKNEFRTLNKPIPRNVQTYVEKNSNLKLSVGPGKKPKINKRRTYVYSGV